MEDLLGSAWRRTGTYLSITFPARVSLLFIGCIRELQEHADGVRQLMGPGRRVGVGESFRSRTAQFPAPKPQHPPPLTRQRPCQGCRDAASRRDGVVKQLPRPTQGWLTALSPSPPGQRLQWRGRGSVSAAPELAGGRPRTVAQRGVGGLASETAKRTPYHLRVSLPDRPA